MKTCTKETDRDFSEAEQPRAISQNSRKREFMFEMSSISNVPVEAN